MSETLPSSRLEVLQYDPRSLEAALERQEWCAKVWEPEEVASIEPEDDHTKPALLGDQFVEVTVDEWGEEGRGKIPVFASLDLTQKHENITEVFIVQHGVLRNAFDYYRNMITALTGVRDLKEAEAMLAEQGILVIAPQFTAPIDTEGREDEGISSWMYNDWRGGEPALSPGAPISSFTAMDAVIDLVRKQCPQLHTITGIGNSEGGQFWDRYASFGEALDRFEAEVEAATVEIAVCNMGSALSLNTRRPNPPPEGESLEEPSPVDVGSWGWYEVEEQSEANAWPFGMYDPPPYIQFFIQRHMLGELAIDFAREHPLVEAAKNYIRRVTICVGGNDNSAKASQLPTGKAVDPQGKTRVARAYYKWQMVEQLARAYEMEHSARLLTVAGAGHAALTMLAVRQSFSEHASTFEETY